MQHQPVLRDEWLAGYAGPIARSIVIPAQIRGYGRRLFYIQQVPCFSLRDK